MRIELKNTFNYQFEASNPVGKTLTLDAPKVVGGGEAGFRPMELILAGLAGCSAFGIVTALREMNIAFSDLQVDIKGERRPEPPAIFTEIHLHFVLHGKLPKKSFYDVVEGVLDSSCSAAAQVAQSARISFSCEVNAE